MVKLEPGVEVPEMGRTWRNTPKTKMRIRPVQNVGRLQNTSAPTTTELSTRDPRRAAATMPRPIPSTTTRMVAAVNRMNVFNIRSASTSTTGRWKVIEVPNCPVNTLPR